MVFSTGVLAYPQGQYGPPPKCETKKSPQPISYDCKQDQECKTSYEEKCETKYEEVCEGYGYDKHCHSVPKEHCHQVRSNFFSFKFL